MITKEAAFQKISELVNRFEEQYGFYKNSEYNETLTRRDFIDPFFKALGWDVDNENGYAESYREVIHEDKLKVGKATKAPDYSFRLVGGKRLFFVEAKKPSVVIKDDLLPAYQLRRYGWNAKLPISLLTDFEEFAVYDCTKKPSQADKAHVARIAYFTFREYKDKFDFLWETFSKEQVLKGSFDKFVLSDTHKKGTTTVDKEFLKSLDTWRTYLATSVSWNNKNLTEEEINYVVQQTIDRIIFLRIAEDRGIEPENNLKHCIKSGSFYQNLFEVFKTADDKYNSGLFDFKKDLLSAGLMVDNKVIKNIIDELYYPNCEYEFGVMPVEILGTAYEQFLGKTIRITPAHHAKIEEKPEVRKAGGVYYTPQFIVDYIVKNTVGRLVENKTPKEVSEIKIVDPACGSGSFLLGAYQFLLDWHKDYYSNHGKPSKGGKNNPLTPTGSLTTAEKKRILLNNIYGVDIDVNAVEVTKLSLLLKCLEGETEASINTQFKLFNERVLPSLDHNIQSGNSLIETDFYSSQLDFGEEKRIKPFNWQKAFPEVFQRKVEYGVEPKKEEDLKALAKKAKHHAQKTLEYVTEFENQLSMVSEPEISSKYKSGFDVVIGNPPYGASFLHPETEYLFNNYILKDYQIDSYLLFIEKGFRLLNPHGFLGFIVPNTWLLNLKSVSIRKHVFTYYKTLNIVHFQKPVFTQAIVDTEIIVLKKSKPEVYHTIQITIVDKSNKQTIHEISQQTIIDSNGAPVNIFDFGVNQTIKAKLAIHPVLNTLCKITQGTKPFQIGKGKPKQTKKTLLNKPFVTDKKEDELFRPLLRGSMMNRYQIKWNENYFIKFGDWLAEPRYSAGYDAPEKIIIRQTGDALCATLDTKQFIVRDNLYTVINVTSNVNLRFILGIINSRLLNWYYQNVINPEKGEVLAQVKRGHVALLPIVEIKESNQKKYQNEIVNLVNHLLQYYSQLPTLTLESDRQFLKGKIDFCENRINQLVYELYGLTEEEIEIVEGRK